MKTLKRAFVIGSVSLLVTSSAFAGPRFSLFGDGDRSDYVTSGTGTTGSMGFGGGLGLEIPLGSMTGIEVDGIYLNRKNVANTSAIEIPVLFRVWFGQIFTLGAGFYYDQGIGSASVGGASQSFNSAGLTNNNLGVMGVLGFNIPLSDSMSIIAEGRYGFGVYNVSYYSGTSTTLDDIQVIVGLRIGSFDTSSY